MIEMQRRWAGLYLGQWHGTVVSIIQERSAYGDFGWWWYVGNARCDQPFRSLQAAKANLFHNLQAQPEQYGEAQ